MAERIKPGTPVEVVFQPEHYGPHGTICDLLHRVDEWLYTHLPGFNWSKGTDDAPSGAASSKHQPNSVYGFLPQSVKRR